MTLSHVIEIGSSPVGIMVEALALGLLLSRSRRHLRLSHRLLAAGAVLFLIYLFSPLSEILIRSLEIRFAPLLAPPTNPKIENIVVLSGYGEDHPEYPITSNLSEQTVLSLAEGIRLYRMSPGSRMIFSGGVLRAGEKPVARMMAEFATKMGVADKDILVEGNSNNTYENLSNSRQFVGTQPFILVASACDLRRAVAVARKLGMQPVAAPAGIWALQTWPPRMSAKDWLLNVATSPAYPSQDRLSRLQWAYHEYLGYLWYWILDRI